MLHGLLYAYASRRRAQECARPASDGERADELFTLVLRRRACRG